MVNWRTPAVALLLASAACTRNVYAPVVVGVPLTSPPDDRSMPVGSAPPVTVQMYEATQHAESWLEYDAPVAIDPRLPLVVMLIVDGPALTKRDIVTRRV